MLKLTGNKEFIEWWEHWMSRIHPNRSSVNEGKGAKLPNADKEPAETNKKKEDAASQVSADPGSARFKATKAPESTT
jgi:hypothetical protein